MSDREWTFVIWAQIILFIGVVAYEAVKLVL
jgi:hypothetical protein